jgi:hypothetical protein
VNLTCTNAISLFVSSYVDRKSRCGFSTSHCQNRYQQVKWQNFGEFPFNLVCVLWNDHMCIGWNLQFWTIIGELWKMKHTFKSFIMSRSYFTVISDNFMLFYLEVLWAMLLGYFQ